DTSNQKGVSDIVIADGFSTNPVNPSNNGSTGGVLFLSGAAGNLPTPLRLFTSMSQASDFDGKDRLNDLAIIEQTTGAVFLLNNISNTTSPTVSVVSIKDLFTNSEFIPTSVTTFVDPITGLNNLAITAVSNRPDGGDGLLIIAINDGSGSFNKPTQFRQFVATSGATNLRSGDFRNTGRASDLVYTDYLNNLVAVAVNDGRNFFLAPKSRQSGGFSPVSMAIADVNDDDHMDVMVLNSIAAGIIPKTSSISVLLGQGDGQLIPSGSLLQVPGVALSITGGLGIIDNSFIPQIIDFNLDGFPDFAVNSTGGGQPVLGSTTVPLVSLLVSRPDTPGQFIVQPPVSLFDETVAPDGKNVTGAVLALDSTLGGAGLISSRGLTNSPLGAGFGGANQTLAVGDFNSDGSPDLVATGSIRTMQNFDGSNSLTPVNYRASSYLVDNNGTSVLRVSRPMRIREYTNDGAGTSNLAANGGDTFVACATGNFAPFSNAVLDVVHLSINGSLFIDGNITSVLAHAPILDIKRSDLNAPFPGGGRKVILTSGQQHTLHVTSFKFESDSKISFSLVPTSLGIPPPSFVKLINKQDSTDIVIDTRVNGLGVNQSNQPMVFPMAVQGSIAFSGPGGRFLIAGYSYFTLVVKPKTAPTIAPIANVNIETGKSQTINLHAMDKDGSAITLTKKCDKDSYVSLSGTTLTIAPTQADT
ncbi:MAG: hypothetical protein FD167_3448, partial [bacterium]